MFTRDQVFAGAALKCKQIWCNLRIPNLNELVSHSRLRLSVDHPLDSQSQSSQFALIGTSFCLIEQAKSRTSPNLQLFTTSIHFLLDELRTPFLSFREVELLLSLEPMSHLWDSSHLRSIVCCHCILVILLDPLLNQEVRPHLLGCHPVSPLRSHKGRCFRTWAQATVENQENPRSFVGKKKTQQKQKRGGKIEHSTWFQPTYVLSSAKFVKFHRPPWPPSLPPSGLRTHEACIGASTCARRSNPQLIRSSLVSLSNLACTCFLISSFKLQKNGVFLNNLKFHFSVVLWALEISTNLDLNNCCFPLGFLIKKPLNWVQLNPNF